MLSVTVEQRLGEFSLDVSFESSGDSGVLALAGVSGSGKTSVLRCIAGLSRPDAGRIAVGGRVLFDRARGVDLPPHRRRLGVVFQDSRLFPHKTVEGNLRFGVPRDRAAVASFDEVVALLGLEELLHRRPGALSGGETQRVAIGRALLSSPALLLMDEPLASLDPARKADILPYLQALPRRFSIPIVYVTHSLDELLQLADEVVVLEQGRVVASGPVAQAAAALGHAAAVETVLEGVVSTVDEDGLTLDLGGVTLVMLPVAGATVGERLRVRVRSDEVVLATAPPSGLSIQNRVPARVLALRPDRGGVRVELGLGERGATHLSALVTRAAADALGLAAGLSVTALLKASALRPPGGRRPT